MIRETIYSALKRQIGREPSHAELVAEARRILSEAAIERSGVGAKPTGFPIGGWYATNPDGATIRDPKAAHGTLPRRFKTPEAAIAWGEKVAT